MNALAKTDLTFQNFTFNPVTENGQVWLTSTEIAKVLGYSRSAASVVNGSASGAL